MGWRFPLELMKRWVLSNLVVITRGANRIIVFVNMGVISLVAKERMVCVDRHCFFLWLMNRWPSLNQVVILCRVKNG